MANVSILKNRFLDAMEQDVNNEWSHVRHGTSRGTASVYNFAGINQNGNPTGISGTGLISLNRLGQQLLFLSSVYEMGTSSEKSRVAQIIGKMMFIFSRRPVFNSSAYNSNFNFETNGMIGADPSGPLTLLGLIALDKAKVSEHSQFITYSGYSTDYFRNTIIPRIAMKVSWAGDVLVNSSWWSKCQNPKQFRNFHGQKYAEFSINGPAIILSTLGLFSKLYSRTDYNKWFTYSTKLHNNIAKDWGTIYDANGNAVDPYTNNTAGMRLSLAVGGPADTGASRAPFPSAGYNSIVGLSLMIQGLAEAGGPSTTIKLLVNKNPNGNNARAIDALKIMNYYRDRISYDQAAYELGAHNNMGFSAERFRYSAAADLYARLGRTPAYSQLTPAQQQAFEYECGFVERNPRVYASFYEMSRQDSGGTYHGQGAYLYPLAFVLPSHSMFNQLANAYDENKGKPSWEIDYSRDGYSVETAFASTDDGGVGERVVCGLAAMIWAGQTYTV